ncbi:MAG TPA: hypothetical protein VHY20_04300 [Pirellulales bacterium]|jgi:hypothetical protein|nr:hypothetical protein [Pirellulales bacterium]
MLKSRLVMVVIALLLAAGLASAANRLYEGKIVVAGDGKVTVVDKDGDNDDFIVSSTTRIMRDGKSAKVDDLQAGDRVKINAQPKGTSLEASDIEAHSAE